MDLDLERLFKPGHWNKEAPRIDNDSNVVKHSPLLNISPPYSEPMEILIVLILNFLKDVLGSMLELLWPALQTRKFGGRTTMAMFCTIWSRTSSGAFFFSFSTSSEASGDSLGRIELAA